jgi:hypothetical protein
VAAQAGPEPGSVRSLTGAGARADGGATVGPAPVVSLSQVAGDTANVIGGLWS